MMQLQKNLNTEGRLKLKERPPTIYDLRVKRKLKLYFRKSCSYYYVSLLLVLSVILLSSCGHQMPSSLEVAVHGVKTVYNKCSDLDNWGCLWYNY